MLGIGEPIAPCKNAPPPLIHWKGMVMRLGAIALEEVSVTILGDCVSVLPGSMGRRAISRPFTSKRAKKRAKNDMRNMILFW